MIKIDVLNFMVKLLANVVFLIDSTLGQDVMTTLKRSDFFNPTRVTFFVTLLAAFVDLFAAYFVLNAQLLTLVVDVVRIFFCVTMLSALMSTIKTNVAEKMAKSVVKLVTAFDFNLVTAFRKDFHY